MQGLARNGTVAGSFAADTASLLGWGTAEPVPIRRQVPILAVPFTSCSQRQVNMRMPCCLRPRCVQVDVVTPLDQATVACMVFTHM